MNIGRPRAAGQVDHELIERMAALLARYPDIPDTQRDALVAFLSRGPLIERGTLLGRPGMSARYELLERRERRAFGMSAQGLLVILGLIVAVVGAAILLWDFGA